jgi:hypothetical protein
MKSLLVDIPRADVRRSTCADCGKRIAAKETAYIVRGEVWAAAGMHGWKGGYLHERCLAKRLGRTLTKRDYLLRIVGSNTRSYQCEVHPDYLFSREYLEH